MATLTITDSGNYIDFDCSPGRSAIKKRNISKVKLDTKRGKIFLYLTGGEYYEIIYSDVTSPSTVNITALYDLIIGYSD